jgi:hypothetical protein
MYLIIGEFEVSDTICVSLDVPKVSHMSVARVGTTMRLPIGIVMCGKAQASIARVSQVTQFMNVKCVLLVRGQTLKPPRDFRFGCAVLSPGLIEANVTTGVVLRGMRLHEADCRLWEGFKVRRPQQDLMLVHLIQVTLM